MMMPAGHAPTLLTPPFVKRDIGLDPFSVLNVDWLRFILVTQSCPYLNIVRVDNWPFEMRE